MNVLEAKDQQRLLSKFEKTPGCWVWNGTTSHWGYGLFKVKGHTRNAHVVSYEHHIGPVPDGLVLDHLCRNRLCVNPSHLEPVTRAENTMRGEGLGAKNATKTHCMRGHEFTIGNTQVTRQGWRQCRICRRASARQSQARHRAKLRAVRGEVAHA